MDKLPKRPSLDGVRRRPAATPPPVQSPQVNRSQMPAIEPTFIQQGPADSTPQSAIGPQSSSKRTFREFFTKRRLYIGVGSILGFLVIMVGLIAWLLHNNIIVANTGSGAIALQGKVDPTLLKGEGDGRVNILLIGVDDAAGLSDTIILASLDPIARDVAMLSVPRDLYVAIPGFGSTKINAAHAYGERYAYEGGGPQLLIDTLEEVLAVPIHYYARANFRGFKQAIDTVDGVEVTVEEDLIDYHYPDDATGGYDPFTIRSGVHTLDGEKALKYARSRYSTSDFDRSRRQQQILLGLKSQALTLGTISNPSKVTNLLRSLSSNAQTNLRLEEIMRLIELAEGVDSNSVIQAQLDASEDNFLSFSNVYGQSVLVPTAGDYSQIQEYVRGLLIDSYIKDEAASVSVLNGTERPGLATETGALLRSFGYQVDNIDNASEQNYTQTVIFDYTGNKPYTLRYLEQRFGVTAQRRQKPVDREHFDIEVVIGGSYEPSAR